MSGFVKIGFRRWRGDLGDEKAWMMSHTHRYTYNDTSIFLILYKSIMKPHKFVVFSNGCEISFFESFERSLHKEMGMVVVILLLQLASLVPRLSKKDSLVNTVCACAAFLY